MNEHDIDEFNTKTGKLVYSKMIKKPITKNTIRNIDEVYRRKCKSSSRNT